MTRSYSNKINISLFILLFINFIFSVKYLSRYTSYYLIISLFIVLIQVLIVKKIDFIFNLLKKAKIKPIYLLIFSSIILLLDFKQEEQIKQVWLNLKHSSKYYTYYQNERFTDITVNYGNGRRGITSFAQIGAATSTTEMTNPGGASYPAQVGDEIEFTTGALAGQRTFITDITNPATSQETWTVSPAVSGTTNGSCDIRVWRVKKGEQKTISINYLDKPHVFNVNFKGSKMYLEIVVRGNTAAFPVSLMDIQLF